MIMIIILFVSVLFIILFVNEMFVASRLHCI